MKWISVKDELPELNAPVLTVGVDEGGGFLSPIVARLGIDGKFLCGYCFAGDRQIQFIIETKPTHWCELPQPPET